MKIKHLGLLFPLLAGALLLQGCPASSPSAPAPNPGTPTATLSPTITSTATPNVTPVETLALGYLEALNYTNGKLYGVDYTGNLYKFADTGSSITIDYQTVLASGLYTTMASTIYGGNVILFNPDSSNKIVRVSSDSGTAFAAVTTFGTGFFNINGVGLDGAGNVYLTDSNNGAYRIQHYLYDFSTNGATNQTPVTTLGVGLNIPGPFAYDGSGFFVGSLSNASTALIYHYAGNPLSAGISFGGAGGLSGGSNQIAVDPLSGDLFVAGHNGNAVEKYSPTGTLLYSYNASSTPLSLAFDGLGHMYVGTIANLQKINTP